MKTCSSLGLILVVLGSAGLPAQTNTFPSSGNAGIGTTTPAAMLEIWQSYSPQTDSLRFGYNDGSAYWMGIRPYVVGGGDVGYRFRVNNHTSTVDALAITGTGRIGIGTTSPQAELDINGGIITRSNYGLTLSPPTGDSVIRTSAGSLVISSGGGGSEVRFNYNYGGGSGGIMIFDGGTVNNVRLHATGGHLNIVPSGGNVGIGTTTPSHKLSVNGTIRAKEIIVDTGWADYVFADDYRLAPLTEVEAHIKEHRHLPGIPSAAEVADQGVSLGEMQSRLLAKVEELTLHLIAQEKKMKAMQATHESEIAALKAENAKFYAQFSAISRNP